MKRKLLRSVAPARKAFSLLEIFEKHLAEFQSRFEKGDRSYEYWYGRAIPKGMPTWLHGILQRIVMELLTEAGYERGVGG